jgi:hypothetical protein
VIEGKNLIEEHEAGVWNSEFILGQIWQLFDLPNRIVGEKTNCTGSKRWQAWQTGRFVSAKRSAQNREDVIVEARYFAAFGNDDFAAASHDPFEWGQTNEGITPNLLAALDRFKQKTFAFRPSGAQKSRNGCFQVGSENAANRDESMFFGERQKLFAGGLDEMA